MKRLLILFFLTFACFASAQSVRISPEQKTLDYFLQQAVQNSPLFVENKNKIQSLKYDSLRIRALYKPQVNFDNNNVYAPVLNGFGYDNAITNGGWLSALVGANLTVVGKQNLNNQFMSLQLQGQSLQLAGKLSEKELKKNITEQYITIYGEQEMLRNTEAVLSVLGKEEVILKKLSEQGVYRETDYLSFLVNYKQQELAYDQRKLQFKNDLSVMNYSCGIIDTSLVELEKPALEQKMILQSAQTLAFRQYTIDSLIIKNNYEQVKFNYKPRLNAFGDAGYNSSFVYQAQKNFGASAGLHLIIPVYDGRQRNIRYEKLKLEENTRINYMQFFKKQYAQKVSQLQQQIFSTKQLTAKAKSQLSLSDALVRANQKLLTTGDAKIADYILGLTNYITAQSIVLQLHINELLLTNAFNYLNY